MNAAPNAKLTDRPIGVFDSGMGGLTVMRALMAHLPREGFVYLGDTARLPYGSKSAETVTRYAVQCAGAVAAHGIKLLVVACNTASAVTLPALKQALAPTPVIGVIEPGAEAAVAAAPAGRIAVIATEGTVAGGAPADRRESARRRGLRAAGIRFDTPDNSSILARLLVECWTGRSYANRCGYWVCEQ